MRRVKTTNNFIYSSLALLPNDEAKNYDVDLFKIYANDIWTKREDNSGTTPSGVNFTHASCKRPSSATNSLANISGILNIRTDIDVFDITDPSIDFCWPQFLPGSRTAFSLSWKGPVWSEELFLLFHLNIIISVPFSLRLISFSRSLPQLLCLFRISMHIWFYVPSNWIWLFRFTQCILVHNSIVFELSRDDGETKSEKRYIRCSDCFWSSEKLNERTTNVWAFARHSAMNTQLDST